MEHSRKSITNSVSLVFKNKENGMFISEVNYNNKPLQYTKVLEEALTIPNNHRFSNSSKYKSLFKDDNIEILNMIKKTEYIIELEGE